MIHFAGNMWEDIVVNPIESLPKVLSPRKVPAGIHVDEGTKYYDNEGSSDVDFVDSDYELDDGMMTYFMTMLMMGWLMRVQARAWYSAKGRTEMPNLAKGRREQIGNGMS